MSFLFGEKKKDPKEVMRESQKALKKTEREMERERNTMKRQEEAILKDIKKAAKDGNMAMARTLAKQLVRVREQQNRTATMKAQVHGVSSSLSIAASQGKMVQSMATAGKAMGAMNKEMDPMAMAKMMGEFQQESDKMEDKQSIMDDALDAIFDEEGMEEEADSVTAQVLEEIGLDMMGKMINAPTRAGAAQVAEQESAEEEDELAARLAALKS